MTAFYLITKHNIQSQHALDSNGFENRLITMLKAVQHSGFHMRRIIQHSHAFERKKKNSFLLRTSSKITELVISQLLSFPLSLSMWYSLYCQASLTIHLYTFICWMVLHIDTVTASMHIYISVSEFINFIIVNVDPWKDAGKTTTSMLFYFIPFFSMPSFRKWSCTMFNQFSEASCPAN